MKIYCLYTWIDINKSVPIDEVFYTPYMSNEITYVHIV